MSSPSPGPSGPPGLPGRGARPVRARRRGRGPAVRGIAVLLVPVVELVVALQVGRAIGTGLTVLLLLLACAAGFLVVRHEGTSALRSLRESAAAGPFGLRGDAAGPGARAAGARAGGDTALVVLAGVLLLVPGFVTDVAGLLLLVPGVREVVRRSVRRSVERRLQRAGARVVVVRDVPAAGDGGGSGGGARQRPSEPRVIEGVEVVEVRDLEPPPGDDGTAPGPGGGRRAR